MSKTKIILTAVALAVVLFSYKFLNQKENSSEKSAHSEQKADFYYTCPMHPQIHQDHPGECPICHMKLVKVTKTEDKEISGTQDEKRSSVHVSQDQLELIGVQKSTVEKMTLTAKIPVSGRLINTSTVAFYIYEKDLINIKPGLPFKGDSSVNFDAEISGEIISVDSVVDPTTRTVRVLGRIQKGPQNIMSETSFSGAVLLKLQNRLAIPESAVLHTGQGDLVYLVSQDNKLKPTRVKLGSKAESYYEVLSGLKEGDEISSGPNFLIDSEAKIRGAND